MTEVDEVRAKFTYDEIAGKLLRQGVPAGYLHCGYVITLWRKKHVSVHRLVWIHQPGAWPSGVIDHINGVKHDNRMGNLRDVTHTMNKQNRLCAAKSNKLGLLGVRELRGRFTAQISVNKSRVHLGTFDSPEAAHEAYLNAKRIAHPGCTI